MRHDKAPYGMIRPNKERQGAGKAPQNVDGADMNIPSGLTCQGWNTVERVRLSDPSTKEKTVVSVENFAQRWSVAELGGGAVVTHVAAVRGTPLSLLAVAAVRGMSSGHVRVQISSDGRRGGRDATENSSEQFSAIQRVLACGCRR